MITNDRNSFYVFITFKNKYFYNLVTFKKIKLAENILPVAIGTKTVIVFCSAIFLKIIEV